MDLSTKLIHLVVGVKLKGAPEVFCGNAEKATENWKQKTMATKVVKGKDGEEDTKTNEPLFSSVIWYGGGKLINSRKLS